MAPFSPSSSAGGTDAKKEDWKLPSMFHLYKYIEMLYHWNFYKLAWTPLLFLWNMLYAKSSPVCAGILQYLSILHHGVCFHISSTQVVMFNGVLWIPWSIYTLCVDKLMCNTQTTHHPCCNSTPHDAHGHTLTNTFIETVPL